MIKKLIISGGGYNIFNILGIIYQLQKKNIYNINNIDTIYGVSAGSIIGSILCLKPNMDDLLNYTINRPWNKDIIIEPENILNLFNNNGIFNKKFINIILDKLLLSKNLDPSINLLDFYKFSNIELHIFSLSCNNIKLIDFSYKTHPNIKLIDAIYMSSSIPFIFQPMFYNNSYMVDGGILKHFPYDLCNGENNEKLGILINKSFIDIDEKTNFLNLYSTFFGNLIYFYKFKNYEKYKENENIIIYNVKSFNKILLLNLINNKEVRRNEIEKCFEFINEKFKELENK